MVSREIVTKLTNEQEALIPEYREKWRSIQNLVEPIERDKVTKAIDAAYSISGYPKPDVLFYNNPLTAIQEVICTQDFKSYLGRDIRFKFSKRVFEHVQHGLSQQLDKNLFIRLRNQTLHTEFPYYSTYDKPQSCYFPLSVMSCLERQLLTDIEKLNLELEFRYISDFTTSLHRPAEWASWACMFDFCISVLKFHHDKKKWQIIQQLIQDCGFLFQYEKVCIACDRPCKLSFDEENLLHADEQLALQFADGYSVYANHGKSPFCDW